MSKKVSKEKIVLEYDQKDFCTLYEYQKFLIKHINLGDKIPARVLKKFCSMLTVEQSRIKQEFKKRADAVKEKTLERYLKDKEYIFNKKLPDAIQFSFGNNAVKTKSVCCLPDMLNSLFTKVDSNMMKSAEKDSLIDFLNTSITEYFNSFEGNTDKLFNKYKRDAVIGYIVYKFGFQLSKDTKDYEDQDPPNSLLYKAIAYHTTKKKSK